MSGTGTTNPIHPEIWYRSADVVDVVPGTSLSGLAAMRSRGQGPAYVQHSAHGRVLYRGRDLIEWLESGRKLPQARTSREDFGAA
jgi:hypothetical protein